MGHGLIARAGHYTETRTRIKPGLTFGGLALFGPEEALEVRDFSRQPDAVGQGAAKGVAVVAGDVDVDLGRNETAPHLLQPLEEVRLGGVVGPQPGASPLILFEARRRSDAQAEDFSSIPAISPAPRTGVPPEPVPVAGSKSASARSMNRPTAAARLEGSGAMWTVPSRSS